MPNLIFSSLGTESEFRHYVLATTLKSYTIFVLQTWPSLTFTKINYEDSIHGLHDKGQILCSHFIPHEGSEFSLAFGFDDGSAICTGEANHQFKKCYQNMKQNFRVTSFYPVPSKWSENAAFVDFTSFEKKDKTAETEKEVWSTASLMLRPEKEKALHVLGDVKGYLHLRGMLM